MSEERRIAVYRAGNEIEGNYVKGLLSEGGIPVTCSTDGADRRGEMELHVPDAHAEAAQRIIRAYESQLESEAGSEAAWTCRRCGEENEASFDACWNCQGSPGHA